MDIELLQKRFGLMGARVRVGPVVPWRYARAGRPAGIDIRTDAEGEFFDIRLAAGAEPVYEVVDVRPELRHLLLLARGADGAKEKFLCGHDERHWFVCAVPGASVSGVTSAFKALQPFDERWVAQNLRRQKNRFRRRNEAFVRQGEWFFIPESNLVVNEKLVNHNEPISRGAGSKPHMCQYLYRTGGEAVMVCRRYPNGVAPAEYEQILASQRGAQGWDWRMMRRDARVYVRGRVWHPDHKTVVLAGWHRVLMNTEGRAPGRARVVFLD